jgi:hypothetical protein
MLSTISVMIWSDGATRSFSKMFSMHSASKSHTLRAGKYKILDLISIVSSKGGDDKSVETSYIVSIMKVMKPCNL